MEHGILKKEARQFEAEKEWDGVLNTLCVNVSRTEFKIVVQNHRKEGW
jgi:hypothetical protein